VTTDGLALRASAGLPTDDPVVQARR